MDVTSQYNFNFTYGECSTVQNTIDDIVVSGPTAPATAELTVNISGVGVENSPTSSARRRFTVPIAQGRDANGSVVSGLRRSLTLLIFAPVW